MINEDSITNENSKTKMAIYSRLPVQNLDNQWFWIMKNKRAASFDKGTR